jgi:glycosyltransferase involved in cell wall biosynthesis
METEVEFSIIVETYNFEEGSDWERLRATLRAATAILPTDGTGEMIVADACGVPQLQEMLASQFPHARRCAAVGIGYDGAKAAAARVASGRYLLFLDGDCIPQPEWHHRLLAPLRSGDAVACGGFTRYEGGFLAAVFSVMDFGFLYPRVARALGCYTSNNCAFLRATLVDEVPYPSGCLRCRCFFHAQQLLRRGTPMMLVPEAGTLHEMQPILRERSRRGYDVIAACWTDPQLPQARWLRFGLFSLPLFYLQHVWYDWTRVWAGRADLKLSPWQVAGAFLLFPPLRLIDAAGMLRAFVCGTVEGGWGGWGGRSRRAESAAGREVG